jgi:hypothetical protein
MVGRISLILVSVFVRPEMTSENFHLEPDQGFDVAITIFCDC